MSLPELGDLDVHVWRVPIDAGSVDGRILDELLSAEERERAERFVHLEDRHRFVATRGVLRIILGAHLHIVPGKIGFGYNSHGKPALTGHPKHNSLQFNVSHSGEFSLIAVTWRRRVGIDIEKVQRRLAIEELMSLCCSQREIATIRSLPKEQAAAAFFNCWTRKEAYMKARGEGLSCDLQRFEVSVTPGDPAVLLDSRLSSAEISMWSMKELSPHKEYTAALVVEGHDWSLRCWDWRRDFHLVSSDGVGRL